MNLNDVRCGNLVFCTIREDIVQIGLSYLGSIKTCEPIPITEEWLKLFGFKKTNRNRFKKDELTNDIYGNTGFYMSNVTPEIKYVHQLQNLFFALTGVELELSSNVA